MNDRVASEAAGDGPRSTGRGRAVERSGVGDDVEPTVAGPFDDLGRARDDGDGPATGGSDDALGHRAGEVLALGFGEHLGEPRLAQGERPERDDDPRVVSGATRHLLRMLPIVDAVYPAAKAVFWPWLRYGLRWTIEGEANIPAHGPAILASNHVSYLDPLTLAWLADQQRRRIRFLAKAELFQVRGLGTLLRAAHQIPVYRGTADSSGALSAALGAFGPGRMRRRLPGGHDLRGPRTHAREVGDGSGRAGLGRCRLCPSDSGVRTAC